MILLNERGKSVMYSYLKTKQKKDRKLCCVAFASCYMWVTHFGVRFYIRGTDTSIICI